MPSGGTIIIMDERIRAVERATEILEYLRQCGGSAGVSAISQGTGLAKSTAFRILETLCARGYLRKETSTEQYTFGYKLIELSFSAAGQWDLIHLARPYLEQIKEEMKETAALAVKTGNRYTFVAQAMCTHEYRVNPVLGEKYYLHWAGTGKAILAFSDREDLESILKILSSTKVTERTIDDADQLNIELNEIRKKGFAYSFSERIEGGASISAPLRDARGVTGAAISLIGPEIRLRKLDVDETGKKVVEIARHLEQIYQLSGIGMEFCL